MAAEAPMHRDTETGRSFTDGKDDGGVYDRCVSAQNDDGQRAIVWDAGGG